MSKFKCPQCKKEFEIPFFKWIFTAAFHNYSFIKVRDYRKTRCPHCKKKSFVSRLK